MKKIILTIIILNFIWFILPLVSFAMSKEDIEGVLTENYNFSNGVLNDTLESIYNKWEDNQSFYMITRQGNSEFVSVLICESYTYDRYLMVTNLFECDITLSTGNGVWVNSGNKVNGTHAFGTGTYTVNEWSNSSVDYTWINVSYDSSVPTPSIDVDLSKNLNEKVFNNNPNATLYGQLGPEIPYFISIKSSSAYENYYLYLDMTVWTPTSGELKLENGIYSFTPKGMYRTEEIPYLDWSDLVSAPTSSNKYYATNEHLFGTTVNITQQENLNEWYNIRRGIELGTSDYPEMEYTTTLTRTNKDNGISRINQMLRNASLAGNRIRFRACLYYINESNEIKCGNFATWTSAQPSTPTTEQPSINAQSLDQPASGITQTVSYDNVLSENDNNSNIPPVNVSTGGSNINVTVNTGEQNVPNNQNYPTVVSYNHDNIFTTFVGTYNSATQYLGDFASFCNSCLLWVPAEIWSIVGLGFAMALIIMIVKIL